MFFPAGIALILLNDDIILSLCSLRGGTQTGEYITVSKEVIGYIMDNLRRRNQPEGFAPCPMELAKACIGNISGVISDWNRAFIRRLSGISGPGKGVVGQFCGRYHQHPA